VQYIADILIQHGFGLWLNNSLNSKRDTTVPSGLNTKFPVVASSKFSVLEMCFFEITWSRKQDVCIKVIVKVMENWKLGRKDNLLKELCHEDFCRFLVLTVLKSVVGNFAHAKQYF